ncbi:hypothetical protein N7474_007597 [Penicillium riverlandense]|uniref:uncharacterized protein n=1 Tax=Penicillium riverlandense TaxID=1903569 RepID=UPI002547E77D|nr:uncharacterized protein N7474_007597 [Penicillium riverlandense]KAJ5811296.1 hypothetical protein N7474_007597 [Penicillium riverlandense]
MTGDIHRSRGAAMKSRNIAIFSIAGVIGGTWLLFRMMAPQRGAYVASNEEMEAFRGGDSLQTDAGNKTAQPPRKGFSVPRGSV